MKEYFIIDKQNKSVYHFLRNIGFLICFQVLCFSLNSQSHPLKKFKPFTSGEKLTYQMKYGFMNAGEGVVELKLTTYEDKSVYHSRITGYTTGLADKLFSVKDIYESIFNPKTCLPYKAIRNVKEGNYKQYNEVFFYHNDCTLYSGLHDSVFRVPPHILDMVSTLYYLRSMNIEKLQPGEAIEILTYFGDEVFPFKIRYKGKETIKSNFGKIECYRFDPVVEPGRAFKSEDDMTMWFSADQNLIPVLIKFNLLISSLKCELSGYSNLKYDIKFQQ